MLTVEATICNPHEGTLERDGNSLIIGARCGNMVEQAVRIRVYSYAALSDLVQRLRFELVEWRQEEEANAD